MRFLRALVNSMLGGLFFAFLLAILVADLNINQTAGAEFLARLTFNLFPIYGLLLAIVCLFGFIFWRFLLGRGDRIALVSPSFI